MYDQGTLDDQQTKSSVKQTCSKQCNVDLSHKDSVSIKLHKGHGCLDLAFDKNNYMDYAGLLHEFFCVILTRLNDVF